jgi:membrane fusion protein, copper/silver efflux system
MSTEGTTGGGSPRRAPWIVALLLLVGAAVVASLWLGVWGGSGAADDHAAMEMADPHADHGATQGTDPPADHEMSGARMADGSLHLSPEMARSLGVVVVEAEEASVVRSIRTTGSVMHDESGLTTLALKISGFVERLYVDFTGQEVRRGRPLLELYSPALVEAQEELLSALRMEEQLRAGGNASVVARASALVEGARRRLALWDIPAGEVERIERTGEVRRTLTLHAASGGFVTEKMVQSGQFVEAGMPLYRLSDLSRVWVEADVYEQDLRFVAIGAEAEVEIAAFPDESLRGRVTYVYPEVDVATRTARVRIELANPRGRIRPGMYATVRIEAPVEGPVLLLPRDAVMHSGTHAMVFVEESPGVYRAREVRVGTDFGARTEILAGLAAGERVVGRANFLLDSESRLTESMGAMPGMNH